jgi:hypothetical protein
MEALGKVQAEQNRVSNSLKGAIIPPLAIPERDTSVILGAPPDRFPHRPPLAIVNNSAAPKVTMPPPTPTQVYDDPGGSASWRGTDHGDQSEEHRRTWMPKMDFPKLDGTDVQIWVNTCNTFFLLYNVAEGFKVSVATMYMRDNAAHWYQAYKLENPWHNWTTFSMDVIQEFEGNVQRDKIRELLTLKQTGTVEEYKKQFDKLVYQIRLYDPNMGGLMLVQRFILGLKEELRAAVEVQLPNTVIEAAMFVATQEAVLDRAQKNVTKPYKKFNANTTKDDTSNTSTHSQKFEKGELWRAKQLKDYRKANGLCFKCGEKFVPRHQCIVVATAQVKAIDANEILSDDVLDALVAHGDDHDCHVSIHAFAGSSKLGTIQFRALVGDQVMLLLLDSGSLHSFVDSALVNKLKCSVTTIPTLKVKVAGGAYMYCDTMVPNMQWWLQGYTFAHDMRVLPLGGYDGILGMDWLEQQGLMTCN